MSLLDDGAEKVGNCMCKSASQPKCLLRKGMGGIVVAFMKAYLKIDESDLVGVVNNPKSAPNMTEFGFDRIKAVEREVEQCEQDFEALQNDSTREALHLAQVWLFQQLAHEETFFGEKSKAHALDNAAPDDTAQLMTDDTAPDLNGESQSASEHNQTAKAIMQQRVCNCTSQIIMT
ncbi:hypothetical protein ACH5RR_032551 [Cinchona calisaya]|uniref:Uncharacterized protein n=1 Tax=Cinchona calisaya TaxID=153742 RepID=A0ABD2YKX4_9GENT